MRSLTKTASVGAAALLALAAGAAAACPTPVKLTMSDAQSPDFAGGALSMSPTPSNGVSLMVGAGSDDTADGLNAGSVYTFARVNGIWGEVGHIFANDGEANDFFGVSVGYADPYAVIGATGVGTSGAAYMFERFGSSWVQATKVFPPGSETGADMGRSVCIRGNEAIVGAPLKDQTLNNITYANAGAAYVYRRTANGWTLVHTLYQSAQYDFVDGDQLGSAVAIGGEFAVAGAPYGENINWPDDMGFLHVHRSDAGVWDYQRRIVSPWSEQGDHYGASVTTDGVYIAAGAPDDDMEAGENPAGVARTNSGCVLIHRFDAADEQWHLEARIFAGDPTDGANFGSSVVLKNGRLIVGADGAKKTYVFRRDFGGEWAQEAVLTDPDSTANGNFASAVAFDGTHVASGDYGDDHNGLTNAGAVYVVTQPGFGQAADSCTAPTAIPGAGEYTGCTELATLGAVTTCGGAQAFQGPDVWYSWTPSCSGNAIFDTFGSDFDTVLSIHSACPGGGGSNTIVCNDDAGGILGAASLVTFDFEADTTYLVRIAGYNLASGNYTLRVWEGVAPSNDSCASPQLITNGLYTFPTCLATSEGPDINGCYASNLSVGHDVWFRYSAACTGNVTIDLCNSNFDTVVGVYLGTGCPSQPGSAIACNDDAAGACGNPLASKVTFSAVQGFQYTIRVGAFNLKPGGMAVMNVYCTPACPADWNGNGQVNSTDISAFLTSWLASVQQGNLTADFNHDQVTNSTDVSAFLTAWLQAVQQGC